MPDQFPEIYTQFLAITLIVGLLIGFVALLTLLYQKKKMQQRKEFEILRVEMENEILSTRVEIQENIQRDISMEIHDNVGQNLLLTNINLTILINQISQDHESFLLIKESKELLKKSMEDLTFLSRSMNPDRIVEIGVFNAIVYELENLKRKNIFDVILEIEEKVTLKMELKPEIQLLLFRIYQEAIKNTLKYAEASMFELKIFQNENSLVVSFKDNGVGYDQQKQEINHGIGVRNMEKRVAIFNGSFEIVSSPGRGTLVKICIPFDQLTSK